MKSKIKDILNSFFSSEAQNEDSSPDQDKIATAVLFFEIAHADFDVTKEEEEDIKSSLIKFFDLSQEELGELLVTARKERDERSDIWLFTHHIKNNFNRKHKLKILDMLWQLVYSDGRMDKYEEVLMRKITNLLGLSHGEMIDSKRNAKG